jgi:nucleoid DNA-binding protein
MMTEFDKNVPEIIKGHLRQLTPSFGLDNSEESLEKITQIWLEKARFFDEQILALNMIEVNIFNKDEPKGALMLTYSGSLISLGSLQNSSRTVKYSSIKLRHNVPQMVMIEDVQLQHHTRIDGCLELEKKPIQRTSALFKMVVCKDDVPIEVQDERIAAANDFLTEGFLKLNRTLFVEESSDIENYTLKSMVKSIALKNDLSIKQTKQVIDDFIQTAQTGIANGKKVSLGSLGNLSVKIKPPQKARIGRNPATGEEITIKTKPEKAVPKFSFSSQLKEDVGNIKINTK